MHINTTNIVPFIQVPSAQLGTILRNRLHYPDRCNFCLEGYIGKGDSDKLVSNIITSATKNVTSLKIEINDKFKARPNK